MSRTVTTTTLKMAPSPRRVLLDDVWDIIITGSADRLEEMLQATGSADIVRLPDLHRHPRVVRPARHGW